MKDSVFVYSPDYSKYKFHNEHPFNQVKVDLTLDLLKKMNAIDNEDIIPPRIATEDELALFHDRSYIEAIKKASQGKLAQSEALNYGIGTEDTPMFAKMHEISSCLVGGSLTAVDYVMTGKSQHAVNLGGGLHHGYSGKASGFCIYNDCSVAIKYLIEQYQARVLYIDTDAHHGDGVQWSFYDEPNVCTFSIHETGRYLFPGTGTITERGIGRGYGYSFNVPLDAFTEDESWLHAYKTAVTEIIKYFKPDVIFSQNGADAHYSDPLTHLSTSIKIYEEIPKLTHQLAHQYCNGRWIAVGGGGYDIWRVVPRAWSHIWLQMKGITPSGQLPEEWIKNWQNKAPISLHTEREDPSNLYQPIPRKKEIEEKNVQTLEKALFLIRREQENESRKNS